MNAAKRKARRTGGSDSSLLPVAASCANCAHWDQQTDLHGHCRFNPPVAAVGAAAIWPRTTREDRCSQFEARREGG